MTNDSLIVITSRQLKVANQMFLERKLYKDLSDEYKKQLDYYERSRALNDSISYVQNIYIKDLIEENTYSQYEISSLLDQYAASERKNKWYKGLTIGGVSIGITGLLLFLLK